MNSTRVATSSGRYACDCGPSRAIRIVPGNSMALVKKSKLTVGTVPPPSEPPVRAPGRPPARPPARNGQHNGATRRASARPQDKISERLAAATEELASGLSEAAAAAEELRRAHGADRERRQRGGGRLAGAACGHQEAVANLTTRGARPTHRDGARKRWNWCWPRLRCRSPLPCAPSSAMASARMPPWRYRASWNPGPGTSARSPRTVSRISDQTNLLALNAAIERRGPVITAEASRSWPRKCARSPRLRRRAPRRSAAAAIQADVRDVAAALQAGAETAVDEAGPGVAAVEVLAAARGHGGAGGGQPGDPDRRIGSRTRSVEAQKAPTRWPARRKNNRRGPARPSPRSRTGPGLEQGQTRPRPWRGRRSDRATGRGGRFRGGADQRHRRGAVGPIQELSGASTRSWRRWSRSTAEPAAGRGHAADLRGPGQIEAARSRPRATRRRPTSGSARRRPP